MSDVVLHMQGISKRYGGVEVLHGIDLDVAPGEVHAVIGQNGAGKSTLMKILNGVTARDAGTIRINGREVEFLSPLDARRHGISMIFQEFSLIPSLRVYQNVFLTKEPRRGGVLLKDAECEVKTAELLAEIGARDLDPTEYVKNLSIGSQQMVEIAKALSSESRILIMDEPTASLSHGETELLFEVIRKLQQRGISILYVSHYLRDVFRICDRVTVLRDGARIFTRRVSETTMEETISAMLGGKLVEKKARTRGSADGEVLLEVRHLRVGRSVRDVSFTLRRGEILGIAGLLGSGRSEIVGAIYGVLERSAGTVIVEGRRLRPRSPRDSLKVGMAIVPEDRRTQGLIMDFSVKENVILPILKRLIRNFFVNDARATAVAADSMRRLNVKAPGPGHVVRLLSGGNQQKVVVAKSMMSDAKILLLDDPTFGIDIESKQEIMNIVSEFAEAGNGVIFISSELDEMAANCDRILVLKKGEIVDTIDCNRRNDVSEEMLAGAIQ